ncbi:10453_t:CDS:2 [Funneliformis mosseae]|uniref:10453_t:CDS:1 n=1 Tax=Funneliformis mosseae TaxID=27381 RepID=A0A9N9AFI5_FUNMO|nr:10453_t:CDS:2 [Funneliformis mosseae]
MSLFNNIINEDFQMIIINVRRICCRKLIIYCTRENNKDITSQGSFILFNLLLETSSLEFTGTWLNKYICICMLGGSGN